MELPHRCPCSTGSFLKRIHSNSCRDTSKHTSSTGVELCREQLAAAAAGITMAALWVDAGFKAAMWGYAGLEAAMGAYAGYEEALQGHAGYKGVT